MNLSLPCPECGRNLKLPLSVTGRSVRCPMCAAVFTAHDPDAAPVPPPGPPLPILPVPPVGANAPPVEPNAPPPSLPLPPRVNRPFPANRPSAPAPTSKTGKRLGMGGLVFVGILAMRCVFSLGSRSSYEPSPYVLSTYPDFQSRLFLDDTRKFIIPTTKQSNWHDPAGLPTAFVITNPLAPHRIGLDFQNTKVTGMALTADDQTLIVACANGLLYKFDPDTGAIQSECDRGDPTPALVAVTPDGLSIAVAHDDSITGVTKLAVHLPELDMIKAVNIEGRKTFQAGTGALAYSPDGTILATVEDGRLRFRGAGGWQQPAPTFEARVLSFSFSPLGRLLAVALDDKSVHVWDLAEGYDRHVLKVDTPLRSAPVFSPSGSLLVGCVGKDLVVWDTKQGKMLRSLRDAKDPQGFRAGAFAPNGRTVAVWQDDGTIRLWDVVNGKVLAELPHDTVNDGWPPVLAFRKNGKTLIAGGGRTVTFWDVPAATK